MKTEEINKHSKAKFEYLMENKDQFALLATNYNDIKTNVIARVEQLKDGNFDITPLYIEITDEMWNDLYDPNGELK